MGISTQTLLRDEVEREVVMFEPRVGMNRVDFEVDEAAARPAVKTGCQEKLENCGMNVEVIADHYYQPSGKVSEPKQVSINAAESCSFPINIQKGTLQFKF